MTRYAEHVKMTAAEYHALPHFSSSVARTLISSSPAHAKSVIGKVPTKEMDRGTAVHRLVLGAGPTLVAVDAEDWRTKDARKERDNVRARGEVPMLAGGLEEAKAIADSVRHQLHERGIVLTGASEYVILWDEPTEFGPIRCKAMLDHVWLDSMARARILDLKVSDSAAPASVERSAENMGYGIQEAAYTRALGALNPRLAGRIEFLFAFAEPDPPHAMNLCRGDGMFRELGERRWLRAVTSWAACIADGKWPDYGTEINTLTAPAWALAREEM